ncbi:MAG: hypothetical protein JSU92_01820 [Deltaproteobacteria bacterium]|nr:MAG: hypothetical protein JSU92_01820 [Deltaproteobacteria bacterium]
MQKINGNSLAVNLRVLCLLIPVFVYSSVSYAELSGYIEARGFWPQGVTDDDEEYITIERFRPTISYDHESVPWINLTVTPQLYFQQGRCYHYEFDETDYSLKKVRCKIEEVDDYLTIERLYLDCYLKRIDFRLGRQAVNWGSAQIWNPTDLFREFFLADYWAERKGIDAAKVFFPLPGNLWLTAVAATDDTSISDNRYGLKLGTTWKDADIAVVFMDDTVAERLVGGVDIKGQFEIGYWFEGAWFFPTDSDLDDHLEFVVGVDYSFPLKDGLIIAAQYYYDGSGERSKQDYDWLDYINRFSMARDYASLLASLAWNDEVSLSLLVISNLNDSTGIITPYLNLLLPSNLQLSFGENITVGPEGGEFRPGDDPAKLTDNPFLKDMLAKYLLPEVPESIYYIWLKRSF